MTSQTTGQLTSGPVLLDVSDGVATITLNRPEAMNSLDIATKEILVEVVRQVSEDPSVRCVVLTGTGRAFCTGQDLKEHINLLETGGSDQTQQETGNWDCCCGNRGGAGGGSCFFSGRFWWKWW